MDNTALASEAAVSPAALAARLADERAADIVEVLNEHPLEIVAGVLQHLTPEKAVEVLDQSGRRPAERPPWTPPKARPLGASPRRSTARPCGLSFVGHHGRAPSRRRSRTYNPSHRSQGCSALMLGTNTSPGAPHSSSRF